MIETRGLSGKKMLHSAVESGEIIEIIDSRTSDDKRYETHLSLIYAMSKR